MTHHEHANSILAWSTCGNNQERTERVAAALAEKDAEIERLKLDMMHLSAALHARELEGYRSREAEIAQLKALTQTLWAALTPEKRHDLNVEMKGVDLGKI